MSPKKKRAPLVGASSCERPFLKDGFNDKRAPLEGASSWERPFSKKGLNDIKCNDDDPDLFLMNPCKERTCRAELDPDILANRSEHDPDLPKKQEEQNENITPPPLKRLRKKTPPHDKQVEQNNNITVAYATPCNMMPTKTSNVQPHRAIVTRGDLLGTSKYYKYHKSMGHTPQYIQHIAGSQKKDFLQKVGFQFTCTNKSISSMTHQSRKQKANSILFNRFTTSLVPCEGRALVSDQLGALFVKASSPGATT